MASLLRQIVAGPRQKHAEANLDLCYVTDYMIATSGPSSTYPQRAYRNPTPDLVKFLDLKHASAWSIWEFRAEGTGYPDKEVYNRIHHYPWPDHHPPPFSLIPNIMASMRHWLKGPGSEGQGRVIVVHCKAGKGRSGTVATSYLISQEGWEMRDALERFTLRRMRSGFGDGISIPSQIRWVGYVDWWTKHGKVYLEREIEIVDVQVWGLRDGVSIGVDGYVDKGKTIKVFHTFTDHERSVIPDSHESIEPITTTPARPDDHVIPKSDTESSTTSTLKNTPINDTTPISDILTTLTPSSPIILPTSDINVTFIRRNQYSYLNNLTMPTSVAHVWFNAYFESMYQMDTTHNSGMNGTNHSETESGPSIDPPTSGTFAIHWDAMDGIKGSARKGVRALDKMAVRWRVAPVTYPTQDISVKQPEPEAQTPYATSTMTEGPRHGVVIAEPKPELGEHVPETGKAKIYS